MHFTSLDGLVIIVGVYAATLGYNRGLFSFLATGVGFVFGALAGVALAPGAEKLFVAQPSRLQHLLIFGAVICTCSLGGEKLGGRLGVMLGSTLADKSQVRINKIVGAFVACLIWLLTAAVLVPTAGSVPGWTSAEASRSTTPAVLSTLFPETDGASGAAQQWIGEQGSGGGLFSEGPMPPQASTDVTMPISVQEDVKRSTVKIVGDSCGSASRLQEGSGFVVGPGLVVTNAHVAAGTHHEAVRDIDGISHSAVVVGFDADADLALLSVPDLREPTLRIAKSSAGDNETVFGHPGGVDNLVLAPAKVSQIMTVSGRDLYNTHDTSRRVVVMASGLARGDSGGAVMNDAGQVVAVEFAIAQDGKPIAYAVDSSELTQFLSHPHSKAVSTQGCISD